ncbi:MAG TPA: hypothetical protein PLD46_02080, partial [Hyphomicrobium sp.]|nr:hypothetical protein [Hyphomicrobium sp.]
MLAAILVPILAIPAIEAVAIAIMALIVVLAIVAAMVVSLRAIVVAWRAVERPLLRHTARALSTAL